MVICTTTRFFQAMSRLSIVWLRYFCCSCLQYSSCTSHPVIVILFVCICSIQSFSWYVPAYVKQPQLRNNLLLVYNLQHSAKCQCYINNVIVIHRDCSICFEIRWYRWRSEWTVLKKEPWSGVIWWNIWARTWSCGGSFRHDGCKTMPRPWQYARAMTQDVPCHVNNVTSRGV